VGTVLLGPRPRQRGPAQDEEGVPDRGRRRDPTLALRDEKAFRRYSEGATILFKRQALDGIHIGEVKQEEGDWHIAGNSGYALVVTGSGATMSDAIEKSYQNVRNS